MAEVAQTLKLRQFMTQIEGDNKPIKSFSWSKSKFLPRRRKREEQSHKITSKVRSRALALTKH